MLKKLNIFRRKKVLLDTNFVLSCIRKKIDFFEELTLMGFQILVPIQVINELKTLKNRKSTVLKTNSRIALELLRKRRYKKIDLKDDKVDRAIVKYTRKNPKVHIATLDKTLQSKFKNKLVIIRGQKGLEVV